MWQTYLFRVHWRHEGTLYFNELPGGSEVEVTDYFNDNKRDDVTLEQIELIGPDDNAVREFARSPDSPFGPLVARRRLDRDEDAR